MIEHHGLDARYWHERGHSLDERRGVRFAKLQGERAFLRVVGGSLRIGQPGQPFRPGPELDLREQVLLSIGIDDDRPARNRFIRLHE